MTVAQFVFFVALVADGLRVSDAFGNRRCADCYRLRRGVHFWTVGGHDLLGETVAEFVERILATNCEEFNLYVHDSDHRGLNIELPRWRT